LNDTRDFRSGKFPCGEDAGSGKNIKNRAKVFNKTCFLVPGPSQLVRLKTEPLNRIWSGLRMTIPMPASRFFQDAAGEIRSL